METPSTKPSFNDDYFVFHSRDYYRLILVEIDKGDQRHEREHLKVTTCVNCRVNHASQTRT